MSGPRNMNLKPATGIEDPTRASWEGRGRDPGRPSAIRECEVARRDLPKTRRSGSRLCTLRRRPRTTANDGRVASRALGPEPGHGRLGHDAARSVSRKGSGCPSANGRSFRVHSRSISCRCKSRAPASIKNSERTRGGRVVAHADPEHQAALRQLLSHTVDMTMCDHAREQASEARSDRAERRSRRRRPTPWRRQRRRRRVRPQVPQCSSGTPTSAASPSARELRGTKTASGARGSSTISPTER